MGQTIRLQRRESPASRKSVVSLAKAPDAPLAQPWAATGLTPDFEVLCSREIDGEVTGGRLGANGASFNLGGVTVTRVSVTLAAGEVGQGNVQGRRKTKAERVAVIDVATQTSNAAVAQCKALDRWRLIWLRPKRRGRARLLRLRSISSPWCGRMPDEPCIPFRRFC